MLEAAKIAGRILHERLPMGLVSSGSRPGIETVLDRFNWRALFPAIVTAKTRRAASLRRTYTCWRRRNSDVPAEACIVFEDTEAGLEAATRAGMRGFDVGNLWHLRPGKPAGEASIRRRRAARRGRSAQAFRAVGRSRVSDHQGCAALVRAQGRADAGQQRAAARPGAQTGGFRRRNARRDLARRGSSTREKSTGGSITTWNSCAGRTAPATCCGRRTKRSPGSPIGCASISKRHRRGRRWPRPRTAGLFEAMYCQNLRNPADDVADLAREPVATAGSALDGLRQLGDVPPTLCHGDLTLENMVVGQDGEICVVDLLDSPFEHYWQDVAKLHQDLSGGWYLLSKPPVAQCVLEYVSRRLLEAATRLHPRYPQVHALLVASTFVRILPYARNAEETRFVTDRITYFARKSRRGPRCLGISSRRVRMKVIVPCCGSSSRFPGQPPKWTLPAQDGRPMLALAIAGLQMSLDDLVVTILREHEDAVRRGGRAERGLRPAGQRGDSRRAHGQPVGYRGADASRALGLDEPFLVKDSDGVVQARRPGSSQTTTCASTR